MKEFHSAPRVFQCALVSPIAITAYGNSNFKLPRMTSDYTILNQNLKKNQGQKPVFLREGILNTPHSPICFYGAYDFVSTVA